MTQTLPENMSMVGFEAELAQEGVDQEKLAHAKQVFDLLPDAAKNRVASASPLLYAILTGASLGTRVVDVSYNVTAVTLAAGLVFWIIAAASGKLSE